VTRAYRREAGRGCAATKGNCVSTAAPLVCLARLCLIALALCGPAAAQPVVARIASATGRNLLYSTVGVPVGLTPGYILNPGDRVDTRGGGRVVIDLSDGSMVVVQPESVIVLKDFQAAASLRELFDIALGAVRVKINHFAGRPNPYRMNTPTASIAVRGTEFSIEVGSNGTTQVVVYEGLVEVSSVNDPDHKTLIEAGRGVLVQAGQDFHFFLAPLGRIGEAGHIGDDKDHHPAMANAAPPPPLPGGVAGWGNKPDGPAAYPPAPNPNPKPHESEIAAATTTSVYDRYMASLSDLSQVPFLMRYNAFAEPYLDSRENPAYASEFHEAEGRIFVLPTFSGLRGLQEYQGTFGPGGTLPGDYSVSPQFSMFVPLGGGKWTVGGSVSASLLGNSSDPWSTAAGTFYQGAFMAARRFGANTLGLEFDSLRGTGSVSSTSVMRDDENLFVQNVLSSARVSQSRFTLGYSRELTTRTKLGVYYRYGLISAGNGDVTDTINGFPQAPNSINTSGHSFEVGMRLRGALTRKLLWGTTASWTGLSLEQGLVRGDYGRFAEHARAQRGSFGVGLGYALTRRVMLTLDAAGGMSRNAAVLYCTDGSLVQNGVANSHFESVHGAVQAELTRHLFVSASLLNVWQRYGYTMDAFSGYGFAADSFFPFNAPFVAGTHFSDFGVGWRFSRGLFAQYLYSTSYGASAASHTLMLRYTFKLKRE